jgi:hypothetical protein
MTVPRTFNEKLMALSKIAKDTVSGTKEKERFVKFGVLFWGKQEKGMDTSYVQDWVRRFNRGEEYIYADNERTKLLVIVDGKESAKRRAKQQMKNAGWGDKLVADQLKLKGLS